MDGETTETLAGLVRLLQRARQLASFRAEGEGPRSPRQLVALGIDLVAKEVRNLLPDGVDKASPTPIGKDDVGLLRLAQQLLRTVTASRLRDAARLAAGGRSGGEANTSAGA
jgi:hypothetical protein